MRIADRTVIGFEALARWDHPERGLMSPASFLPDIEKAGLSQRLAEVVLKQSLMALNTWDAAGFDVASLSDVPVTDNVDILSVLICQDRHVVYEQRTALTVSD